VGIIYITQTRFFACSGSKFFIQQLPFQTETDQRYSRLPEVALKAELEVHCCELRGTHWQYCQGHRWQLEHASQ